jgi:hypothetical protein
MRKILLILIVPIALIGLISLTDKVKEQKKPVYQTQNGSGDCNTLAKASGSCEGCHSGSSSGGGPIVIIYENGKTGSEFNLAPGENEIFIYNEDENVDIISELENNNIQVFSNTKPNVVEDRFVAVHGPNSSSILSHITKLNIVSKENQVINLGSKPSNISYSVSFNNSSMLLNMNSTNDEIIQISLYDMMGKSYIAPTNKNIISGENQINLDTQLPIYRGVYIVRITEQSGKTSTKKIFID